MKKVSPDRWRKIEALMDQALEVPASEREELVRKEAKDDVDLAEQVLKLLAAGDESSEFMEAADSRSQLEGVLAKMAHTVEENESVPEALTKVGPYQIVRQLGRGGMGQVYLAVRDDEAFKRYVALKIIRRGMDSEDIRVRFRTERRILASLTHPNIARLLDGGSTEDGQAYFVMDFVDGKPIDVYCDDHQLSLKERLELFEKVASAVHYAHQNLIVHRDLKPGNILVTEDGTVKLLDFGIAKFLNPGMAGYTVPMTKTEVRVMTPEYASPEQVRGEAVTTASDVYQLGILLYELLTGHRPFSFETRARGEIEKIILEQAPEKPSTMIAKTETLPQSSVSPSSVSRQRGTPLERLRKQLTGDLDRIVLMALRKEIDRRYQSADQLLKDLQNYRAGRPVSAQADTFRYRATRFVQRNKLGVAAGSIAVLALVLITGISIRYAAITAQQRDQIEIEAKKAG
jgi:eukaryotic-like serine/threonine-protein kinase